MAGEDLELQMLDQIEIELSKIVVDTSISWVSPEAPTLQMAVPGDPVPAPNTTVLYVQHVNSNVGSDGVGTCQHMLDATFHIWCASSYADGHSRMLKLKSDVVTALLKARPAFYARFSYGLVLGAFSFSADEAFVRAGCVLGVQEIHVHALVREAEEDLTEAQALALIRDEINSNKYRRWDNCFPIGAAGLTTMGGKRTVGFLEKCWGYNRYITLAMGTPNAIFEAVEKIIVPPAYQTSIPPGEAKSTFMQELMVTCIINSGTPATGVVAGEAFTGIEYGSFNSNPGAWNDIVDFANNPVIQMRHNRTLNRFEVVVHHDADGLPPEVTPFPVSPTFQADSSMKEFKMHYEPNGGSPTLKCYLNGELMITHQSAKLTSLYTDARGTDWGAGYFVTNGNGSPALNLNETGFYDFRTYTPDFFRYPAIPNPA